MTYVNVNNCTNVYSLCKVNAKMFWSRSIRADFLSEIKNLLSHVVREYTVTVTSEKQCYRKLKHQRVIRKL